MSSAAIADVCVLVVDDDDGIRETLREVVEMAGCSVILAASGEEALEVLAVRRPCLMVLDLMMPGMTGLEVLEAMRGRGDLTAIPVLISTSAPALAPAGLPVLSKPIDIGALWVWMKRSCRCTDLEAIRSSSESLERMNGNSGRTPT